MDPGEAIRRCGGRATWSQLRGLGVTRRQLRTAVMERRVVRTSRGRYRWSAEGEHLDVAHELHATLSHRSAALHHGLEVGTAPELPELVVPRKRRLTHQQTKKATFFYRDLDADEVSDGVTTLVRTVLDCARDLDFREALAVVDSALRHERVTEEELARATARMKGPRAARARRVVSLASGAAANPFESVLRALAVEAGLDIRPQVVIERAGVQARVDLADEHRRLVVEGEGFEHHGTRKGFRRDVRRYTALCVYGWTVLRFTWEEVMLQPDYVRWALESWRRQRDEDAAIPAPPRVLQRLA